MVSISALWNWLNDRPHRLPALILLSGVLIRLLWLLSRPAIGFAEGEAANAAISFAKTGVIGDVFGRGSGATAHLSPISPIIVGYIYRLLGVGTVQAEALLIALSVFAALLSALLFYIIFGLLGGRKRNRLIALALFCLLPLNLQLETTTFRIWEGAWAAAIGALSLLLIIRIDRSGTISRAQLIGTSLLLAFLFFLSPPLGLALYLCAGLWAIRRLPLPRWPGAMLTAIAALVLVLTPWVVRNAQEFGRFIPMRSNFGMELALANHPAAASSQDDLRVFRSRLKEIHPLESEQAFQTMLQSGGEPAYAENLGKQAKAWIAENPGAFARLCVKHAVQYYFPPVWQWGIYSDVSKGSYVKMGITWAIALFGIIGALSALFVWRGMWIYAAIVALVPALPYIITQPVPRYRYIVYAILLFLACEWAGRMVDWLFKRIGGRKSQIG